MYHPQQRYPSARAPVAADNLVATSQPLATEAGLQALRPVSYTHLTLPTTPYV